MKKQSLPLIAFKGFAIYCVAGLISGFAAMSLRLISDVKILIIVAGIVQAITMMMFCYTFLYNYGEHQKSKHSRADKPKIPYVVLGIVGAIFILTPTLISDIILIINPYPNFTTTYNLLHFGYCVILEPRGMWWKMVITFVPAFIAILVGFFCGYNRISLGHFITNKNTNKKK